MEIDIRLKVKEIFAYEVTEDKVEEVLEDDPTLFQEDISELIESLEQLLEGSLFFTGDTPNIRPFKMKIAFIRKHE